MKGYKPRNPERLKRMVALFKQGKTFVEVAKEFGVSHQYVQQVFKKAGIASSDGGNAIRRRMCEQECKYDGCNRLAKTKGYCNKHYQRLRVYGTVTPKRKFVEHDGGCLVDGCTEPFRFGGLCNKHATNFYVNKREGKITDLNDYLKVKKAKALMGKRYAVFTEIRSFMESNKELF
ncbi:hypothetical protein C1I59_13565 [Paenibacillus polymyxa]|uniref:helix-turn-helix domain-containing protein n=1 Tax=Paenibacillus polymyxa TaxID=1406 RepID=UPI0010BEE7FC|nr:helix-turn-helix domain-containing protein [Paenibacillus polymyxa]TKH35977.1 hypothetical protein C1I59_13565 [Paenibacillus polymyxa]